MMCLYDKQNKKEVYDTMLKTPGSTISHRKVCGISDERLKEMLIEITRKAKSLDNINPDPIEVIESMKNWSLTEKLIMAHYVGMIEYKAIISAVSAVLLGEMI